MQPAPESAAYLGPPVDPRGLIVKRRLRLGNAESLAALSDEWSFFSPAAAYLCGRFSDSFLVDYMFSLGRDVDFYFHKFQSPLFRGLNVGADADWNYALWAVRPDEWAGLLDFFCGLTIVDRAERSTYRYGMQEVTTPDPIASSRLILSTSPVTFTVPAFGVYGNRFVASFSPGANPFSPPHIGFSAPSRPEVAFSEAYLNGANPFAARESAEIRQASQAPRKG